MNIIFGVAGTPYSFDKGPLKGKRQYFFDWLLERKINAYEIQCTYGYKSTGFTAEQLEYAKANNIFLSLHGPYYCNLGSLREDVQSRSKLTMKDGILLAQKVGANRLIFHPGGGYGKGDQQRIEGMERLIINLKEVVNDVDMKDIRLYPEIGGKENSLGSLDEIIEICEKVPNCYPCIDIAHLHAREKGSINSVDDVLNVLNKIESKLGRNALEKTHYHCYTIAYTDGGEKKHLHFNELDENTLNNTQFLDNFLNALIIKKLNPWVISEAKDSQDLGAMYMMEKFEELCKK